MRRAYIPITLYSLFYIICVSVSVFFYFFSTTEAYEQLKMKKRRALKISNSHELLLKDNKRLGNELKGLVLSHCPHRVDVEYNQFTTLI